MLEIDICFSKFIATGGLETLNESELSLYQDLLEYQDADLLLLFQGKVHADEEVVQQLIDRIRACFGGL